MQIRLEKRAQGLVMLAALALSLLCASLIFFTWDGLRRQRDLLNEHVSLTSRVIMRGMQANLLRSVRRGHDGFGNDGFGHDEFGHDGFGHNRKQRDMPDPGRERLDPGRDVPDPGGPFPDALFSTLAREGNVQFMALVASDGTVLFSFTDQPSDPSDTSPKAGSLPHLSSKIWEMLRRNGEWSVPVRWNGHDVLVTGMRAHPLLARLCRDARCAPEGGRGTRKRGDVFFIVGMGLGPYLQQYDKFRQGALLQMSFVIAGAALCMLLITAYIKRREDGRRLASLEEVHVTLLDAMPDGLLSLDEDGVIRSANRSAREILEENLVGRPWSSLGPAMDVEHETEGWAQFDHRGRKLEILLRELDDPETPGRLVLVRDRTVFKRMEERLGNAEKLAAVGRMAAGAAHEIRNPLSSLRGFAQFFMNKFKGVAPEEEYAATMVREADRLNKVITDMLFLAKPRSLEPVDVDLNAMAVEVAQVLEPDIREKGARFEHELEIDVVHADADALKQALINLVVNSLAAVEQDSGRVIMVSGLEDGVPWVGVRDNGPGMAPEQAQHALEPFYTTRKEGTGLGLAIVDTIMREHHGRVEIGGGTEQGATVRLVFG